MLCPVFTDHCLSTDVLQTLVDGREQLEDLWAARRLKLDLCLQLRLFEREALEVQQTLVLLLLPLVCLVSSISVPFSNFLSLSFSKRFPSLSHLFPSPLSHLFPSPLSHLFSSLFPLFSITSLWFCFFLLRCPLFSFFMPFAFSFFSLSFSVLLLFIKFVICFVIFLLFILFFFAIILVLSLIFLILLSLSSIFLIFFFYSLAVH